MTFVDFERVSGDLPGLEASWQETGRRGTAFVVLDDLMLSARRDEIYDAFPDLSWGEWERIGDTLQAMKLSSERIARFPASLAAFVHELNSGPMIRLLEAFTGVAGLLPDPHLWGGGLHVTRPGGYLWPHTDFPQGHDSRLTRIINLIVYVHPCWQEEMGGHFQLWSGETVAYSISPAPGRCVVFRTDGLSVHGVSQVAGELDRRSIALFYYSLGSADPRFADRTTGWQLQLPPPGAAIGASRRRLASTLMRASVALRSASIALNQGAERLIRGADQQRP